MAKNIAFFFLGVLIAQIVFTIYEAKANYTQPKAKYFCSFNYTRMNNKNKSFGWGNCSVTIKTPKCCLGDSLAAIIQRANFPDSVVLVNFIKVD